jgi:hypothetical protein
MASWKLRRIEAAEWSPPVLSFRIERHGGTVLGSTRAEVQFWDVDLDRCTAGVASATHRQLVKAAPRLKTGPLVAEIMGLIEAGSDDPRLKWSPDRAAVRVIVSRVIPPDSGFKQTVQGRQRRFGDAWAAAMTEHGWEREGKGMWVRPAGRS